MGLIIESIQARRKDASSVWAKLAKSAVYGVASYTLIFVLICYIVFSPLPANKHPTKWSNLRNSLFISLSRPIFIMCLMVMMTNILLGHGKLLGRFFGSSLWVSFSKLSYTVYLIFPILNAVLISSMSQSLFLSYTEMIYLLVANFVFNFGAAFMVNILVQAPIQKVIYQAIGIKKYHLEEPLQHLD